MSLHRPALLLLRTSILCAAAMGAAGCTAESAPDTSGSEDKVAVIASESSASVAEGVSQSLPPDACTREGNWTFFETFVRQPGLRAANSTASGVKALDRFDIALVDNRWVRDRHREVALQVIEENQTDAFSVKATPVELDVDDNIVRTLGETVIHHFVWTGSCWEYDGTI